MLGIKEARVQFLSGKNPLEEGMATHSSILGWRISWTEELGILRSMGSQRVGHNWSDSAHALMRETERASTSSIEYCVHFLGYHKILTATLIAYNHRNLFSPRCGDQKTELKLWAGQCSLCRLGGRLCPLPHSASGDCQYHSHLYFHLHNTLSLCLLSSFVCIEYPFTSLL